MKIYLLGAINPETIRTANAVQVTNSNIEFALLDDDPAKHGTIFYGFPIVGGLDLINQLKGPDVKFVNLIIDSPHVRHEITDKVIASGGSLGNLLHPDLDLTMINIGSGNYIQEAVTLQAEVSIGENTSIHTGALIGHGTKIGNSVIISHGATISEHCRIGDECFIGINATVLPHADIGKNVTISAGTVARGDIPDNSLVLSNSTTFITNK
ncbi:DapH/DapD/GlmU-related protein [Pseudomonas mohnii]